MRRRITRALFTAAAAGATITSLSFAAAGPASAAAGPTTITTESAGWNAGNVLVPTVATTSSTWNFRYARGVATVPDHTTANVADNDTTENFVVMLADLKQAATADLYWTGTAWNVAFAINYADGAAASTGTACTNTFLTGRQVRLDVFYNAGAGAIEFTAYDGPDVVCTASLAAWTTDSVGGGSFREAYVGGLFTDGVPGDPYDAATSFTRPTADTKLFAVTNAALTSYNGTSGTIIGPWGYEQLEYGSSSSNIDANAPTLWDGGQNFGVWLRA
jgi:TRAP transporter T-component